MRRILYGIHNTTKIIQNQFGFEENKSTEQALEQLFSIIEINLQNQQYTSLISIDFQQAFDSLPWESTQHEFELIGLERPYANIIKNYLYKRRSVTYYDGGTYHFFNRGCPQGSCFGPLLWRVFMNGLLRLLKEQGIIFIAFADDLLVIISGTSRRQLEELGKKAMDIIFQWTQKQQIQISKDKCFSMTISKYKQLRRLPIFKIQDQRIQPTKILKYLGIHIDSKLTFLPHIRNKRTEINKILQNLLKFTSKKGGVSKAILKIWYKTIIERKIAYASPTWYLRMQRSHGLRLLSSIQSNCLQLISGAYKKSSTLALNTLTGIMPLHLQLYQESWFGGITRLHKNIDDKIASNYQQKANTSELCPYKPFSIDGNFEAEIEIFTDGSHSPAGTAYAFCAFKQGQLHHQHQIQLNSSNSIYQAEQLAIYDAIHWSQSSIYNSFHIYTDNLSSKIALEDINTRDIIAQNTIKLLQTSKKKIKIVWIKGHSGSYGNDMADLLAKEAILSSKINFHPFPRSELKLFIKRETFKKWQLEWDTAPVGRFTYNLLPKISTYTLLPHRNLYLFSTNHGPFAQYLYKFNRTTSPLCICNRISDSLHYVLNCPLTTNYHLLKSANIPLHSWFQLILKNKHSQQKIINCIALLENRQFDFFNPAPFMD